MAIMQFTGRGPARYGHPATRALAQAAVAADRASSIVGSRSWRWRIGNDIAELYVDHQHRPPDADPDGRLLTISCGTALHHARTALAGAGFAADITYLPDPADPDLLARIRVAGATVPTPDAVRLQLAMALRYTDRHPLVDAAVPPAVLDRLRDAAEAYGAHVRLLRPDEVGMLTVAGANATDARSIDPRYRVEEPVPSDRRDRVPDAVAGCTEAGAMPREPRPGTPPNTAAPKFGSRHAYHAVLFIDRDTRAGWLAAGEALSAVLLTATAERVIASPYNDRVNAPSTRQLLRGLLGGMGYPVIALRVGVPDSRVVAAA